MPAEKAVDTATTDVSHVEQASHVDRVAKQTVLYDDAGEKETRRWTADAPIVIDAVTNKRLFWKINRRILVVMLVTYFCQSLDKGTLNFASIMGIEKDAHLHGQQYSWLGTILYLGILTGEYPQNFLLQKLPVGKFLAANVFLWGTVVACSAASTNFGALMVVRFLLGLFESSVQPVMMVLTSMWYTREEQSLLNSLWYCMTGAQLMVGGLLAFGVSHFTSHAIKSWQLLFLVLGVATALWAICIAFILPDSPMTAKCFSDEDKILMIERVRHNETGIQNKEYKRYQVLEALRDPFTWCCVGLITVANLVIGGLGVFSNLIIKQFGFTLLQTELLNIAQGALTIIIMVSSAFLSQQTGQTCLVMMVFAIPAVVGTAVIIGVETTENNAGGMLIAFYCTQFFLAEGNMIISLITRNIAGRTKRGVTMTMTFCGWAVGNLVAPQIFQANDAPRYRTGFSVHLGVYGCFLVIAAVTRFLLMARNRSRATEASIDAQGNENISHDLAFSDLTDQENPNFRYVY